MLVRQALYHLNYTSNPFLLLVYISVKVLCFCAVPATDNNPPADASCVAGITYVDHHMSKLFVEMESH
jgi:hypothetical protein